MALEWKFSLNQVSESDLTRNAFRTVSIKEWKKASSVLWYVACMVYVLLKGTLRNCNRQNIVISGGPVRSRLLCLIFLQLTTSLKRLLFFLCQRYTTLHYIFFSKINQWASLLKTSSCITRLFSPTRLAFPTNTSSGSLTIQLTTPVYIPWSNMSYIS